MSLSSHSDTKLKEKGKLKGTSKGNGIVRVREAKSEAVMSGLFPRGARWWRGRREGRGGLKVRHTALVDRVDTLHKLRCTVSLCTLHKIRVSRHKIRIATKRLKFPSTAFLLLPALGCFDEFDTSHYTLDTLQLPNSLLSNPSLPPISQTCRPTPFPPKTWSVII